MAATFNADETATLKFLFSRFCDTTVRLVSLENFTKATSFSKSNLIGKCHVANDIEIFVPFVDLFSNIQNAFENPDDLDEEAKMALTRLLAVRASFPKLLKILKVPRRTESEFNVVLACDVIQPLTGGMCIINSVTDKTVITNSNVKLPADLDLTGIAMGYADGFYGEPDILACPKEQSQKVERPGAVAIQSLSTVEETDDTVSTVKETDETVADVAQHADIIPPARKRRKSNEQRKSSTTGGSPNKTVIEGKKGVSEKTTISALSESLATALTFARIQQKRHSGHHTFPTLRVHPLGVDIILFNAVSDHLMLTCLKWSQQALFMMWLVLHHNIFSFLELPKKYEKYTSGLLSYIANSGAMKTEPKYLVVKNSFELNEAEIEREFRITVWP